MALIGVNLKAFKWQSWAVAIAIALLCLAGAYKILT